MSKVYLVSRSEYEIPMGHRVEEFEAAGLLEWFQQHWSDKGSRRSGFREVVFGIEEKGVAPPENWQQLKAFLGSIYTEGEIQVTEHAIQGITNDDEIDLAWYLFDDHFAKAHPERVSYLLQSEGWRLPTASVETCGLLTAERERVLKEDAAEIPTFVYCVLLCSQDGMTLDDIAGNFRFNGLNLPEFGDFLMAEDDAGSLETRPEELLLLRALLQKAGPGSFSEKLAGFTPDILNEYLTKGRSLSDFKYATREPRFLTGNQAECGRDWGRLLASIKPPSKEGYWVHSYNPPLLQTSQHFCQIRFHRVATPASDSCAAIHQTFAFIFFDGQWATANSDLARSILKHGSGPYVLLDPS